MGLSGYLNLIFKLAHHNHRHCRPSPTSFIYIFLIVYENRKSSYISSKLFNYWSKLPLLSMNKDIRKEKHILEKQKYLASKIGDILLLHWGFAAVLKKNINRSETNRTRCKKLINLCNCTRDPVYCKSSSRQ